MKQVWLGENGWKPYFSASLILLTSKIDAQNDKKLEQILKGIVEESWKTGAERPVKSYELKINSFEEEILELKEGNITANSKGSVQFLPNSIEIFFTAYF